VAAIIIANVAYMGVASNIMASRVEHGQTRFMGWIDMAFSVMYTTELLLRVRAFGLRFILGTDRFWNLFDSFLVAQSIFEMVLFVGNFKPNGSISFLRALRLTKLIKTLRIIRLMRSMRSLRLILFSIMGFMGGMIWSMFLIATVLYMFSMIFVQAAAGYAHEEGSQIDPVAQRELAKYWTSVQHGMLTLFASSTGGEDWRAVAESLSAIGDLYYGIFCLYVTFYVTVLMNTITAVFVETTLQTAAKDLQFTVQTVL
jgi:hypothetical protein